MNNESSTSIQKTESGTIMTAPCKDIEKESIEVQHCCRLFAKLYKNTNIQQIMALMKYSMDISNPWISQYDGMAREKEFEHRSDVNRHLGKAWLAENNEVLLRLFSEKTNMNFLRQFG